MSVFKIRLSLLVILLLPVLISLGLWQLSRYQQKLELEQVYSSRENLPPLSIDEISQYEDPLYLPVKISGRFDHARYFLLDNQVYKGRAGFALIMPFLTDKNELILVNRGWLPTKTRDDLPEAKVSEGIYHIEGTVYRPLGKSFLLKKDVWTDGWPKVIQTLDFNKASTALGSTLLAYLITLNKDQPASLYVQRKQAVMSSDKHMGYALQWFTMAAVLLGLYVFHMRVKEKE